MPTEPFTLGPPIDKFEVDWSFLTLFDFNRGFGESAQLGHEQAKTEVLPRLVEGLANKVVTHISFGGFHTLAVAGSETYVAFELYHSLTLSLSLSLLFRW